MEAVNFSRLEWSVSKLSQWVMDILVRSFQFNSMTFFAMVNDISMNGLREVGMVKVEISPSSAVMGQRGMLRLRISDSLPMTSDQKFWMCGHVHSA